MSLNKRQNNKPLNILNFNCARLKARPQVTEYPRTKETGVLSGIDVIACNVYHINKNKMLKHKN